MNMCAANSGTLSTISAGAAITAQMMYEAVTGTASPTIQTMSAV
jgi:DNA-binding phage protein